ncbi:HAD family hydrolase [Endozoicomonas ascidiicola]|uniref:HAD family hydrolase n=1 Tax=Endozoicomonas ascidiicola TaxID=1698521 RepID=UPI00082E26DA|nr:HAD family hydrolase [Endozoicomonas ascidiicola]
MGELKLIDPTSHEKVYMQSNCIKGAIFDLYGTLIDLNTRPLLREFSRILGVKCSPVKLKRTLTKTYINDDDALNGFIETILDRKATPDETLSCKVALQKHLSTAKLHKGAKLLLRNLKARNVKLALLSNVAQIFKQPFYTLGLEKYFDVIHFSSDIGEKKPSANAYMKTISELGILPSDCMFVGDDVKNDYDAPKTLGMSAVHIGDGRRDKYVRNLCELVWMGLSGTPLLQVGKQYCIDSRLFTITDIDLLSEEELGRYNIVARVNGYDSNSLPMQWYVKRYIDPSSSYIEETSHRIMSMIGAAAPRAYILEGEEPLLFTSPAKGSIWEDGDYCIDVAEQVGVQAAAAYILANADWRPRNTFIQKSTSKVTSIDLEHCLFDRVLDTQVQVENVRSINNLGISTWAYTKTRVLSYSAIKRAIKCFTKTDNRDTPEFKLFLKGWDKTFKQAINNRQLIIDILKNRMGFQCLVIGTKSHRRSFANIDLHDFTERIDLGQRVIRWVLSLNN